MLNNIVEEVAKPILRRLGTFVGGALVSYGIAAETSSQIVVGLVALGGVLIDLLLSHANRKSSK